MSEAASSYRLANLDEFLKDGGSYLIGDTKSLRGVAIASDAEVVYAALKRREGESLDALHLRLDEVVGKVRRGEMLPQNEFPEATLSPGRKRREAAKRRGR